jgi:hypothetical protein
MSSALVERLFNARYNPVAMVGRRLIFVAGGRCAGVRDPNQLVSP